MTRRTGVVLALVWLLSLLLWLRPGLSLPDGGGYYMYLPSTWLDHDLLFFNEWQRFGLIRGNHIVFKDVTPNGHLSNHWTCGAAVVWYPAFVLGDLLRIVIPGLHRFARDGLTLPYNVPVVVTSALAGLAVLLIGAHLAERRFGRFAALTAALGIWFGSPLLWYSLRDASMAHAVAAAACALVVLLSLRLREEISVRTMFAAGLAVGFAAAVRPQNAIFALVPYLVVSRGELPAMIRRSGSLLLGAAVAALPQLVVSQALYGSPLAFVNVGGTAADWHSLEKIWLWQTLFSAYHGMFYWTPLLALGVAGFILLRRADRGLGDAAIVTFLLQWLMNSTLDRSFWAGLAFGARRADGCTIFFLLGVAALVSRLPRWLGASLVGLASMWTMTLFFATRRLDLNEYQTPGELWRAQTASHAAWFRVLGDVPAVVRSEVVMLVIATLALFALLALAARRMAAAGALGTAAAAWLLLVAAGFALCARNDTAHGVAWQKVIDANRSGEGSGSTDMEVELLQQEARYLQRIGRLEEAAAARAEAAARERPRH